MASCGMNSMSFFSGLRGFHVYQASWIPHMNQHIEFKRERNNSHHQYAVAGFAKLTGTLAPSIVCHIPCELS